MPEMLDHVEYLSQQIGPRPAGTEEEQQAALYITEQFQKEAGLSAVIEDFNSPSNSELPHAICAVVTVFAGILSLALPVLLIPAIILSIASAAIVAAETFARPVISPFFARGVSQNVVARYEPGYSAEASQRRRKVIVVARYDSGKVRAELNGASLSVMPVLNWVGFGGLVAAPVLLLVKALFLLNATGAPAIVLTVLTIVALLCAAIPVLLTVLHKLAAYNEGANANASGVAVLMDVACRVGRGVVSEEELASREEGVAIHGEEAALAAGLVPEGAQLSYEAAAIVPPEQTPRTQEERLTAAKAAIAAMTGKPVNMETSLDISENLVQIKEPLLPEDPSDEAMAAQRDEVRQAFATIPSGTVQEALQHAEEGVESVVAAGAATVGEAGVGAAVAAAATAEVAVQAEPSVPAWFKKAQEKAKKPSNAKAVQVHRSRYADALDAAAAEPEPALALKSEPVLKASPQTQPASEAASVPSPVVSDVDSAVPAAEQPVLQDGGETAQMPALPSFLDPAAARAEAASQQSPRSESRVEVAFDPAAAGFEAVPQVRPDVEEPSSVPSLQPSQKVVTLPDIAPAANLAPVEELQKQHAPLAEAAQGNRRALGRGLRSMLPSITGSITAESITAAQPAQAEAAQTPQPAQPVRIPEVHPLISNASIPSLSGALPRVEASDIKVSSDGQADANEDPQATQFMAPMTGSAGMTGAFAPVGNELLQGVDPEDIYIDDADDSVYEESFTETGAFAGPGYVDMPKSRISRLFDRFKRNKKHDDEPAAASEWLGVDEEFDARSVGAARGGWESFRTDDSDGFVDSANNSYFNDETCADGGYDSYDSSFDDEGAGFVDVDYDSFANDSDGFPSGNGRRWNGGAFSADRLASDEAEPANAFADGFAASNDELQQIHQFRNPSIDTEVWFVALGSELAGNAGMRAFLQEHERDLRGSIIIELDSLGAGDLSLVEREGAYRKVKTSSRMKRLVRKATQATGTSVGSADIPWTGSSASYATSHGVQAMHLAGMDGAKPAFFAQGNDVLENVDATLLEERAEYVMALLRNI